MYYLIILGLEVQIQDAGRAIPFFSPSFWEPQMIFGLWQDNFDLWLVFTYSSFLSVSSPPLVRTPVILC